MPLFLNNASCPREDTWRRLNPIPSPSPKRRGEFVSATHSYLLRIKHRRRTLMKAKIILAILILSLATIACGFSVDLPGGPKIGPEVKDSITVADPESDQTRLS